MNSTVSQTKRIASPKMRHVRALSPYSRWQEGGEQGLTDSKSFLSAYAGNTNPALNSQDSINSQN